MLNLLYIRDPMDAPYLLKVQDISKETIEKYPKLEEIIRQVSSKYDKMVTKDCPPSEEVYCDPLHFTRSTINITPNEFQSLFKENGVEYQLERYEGGYEFSRYETSIWTADLRTECQYYHEGVAIGILLGEESGEKQQQDCRYHLQLIKTESNFLTRLIWGQQQ
jgi:hypothetical protein